MTHRDQLIKLQAIQRNREIEFRRKAYHDVPKGLGNTVVGSIHDCNRKGFEKMLRAYWDRLYVGWNPYKREGVGCWEVWARPSKKTPTLAYKDSSGLKIYTTEYRPNDFEHWVADLDYLSYGFIEKLRKMDAWENKHQASDHEYEYERAYQAAEDKEDDEIEYIVKHNRKAFRDLLDYTKQGYQPLQFFTKK